MPELQGQTDIPVVRSNGSQGAQSIEVIIEPLTASRPLDFDVLAVDGVSLLGDNTASVQFGDGETTKFVRISVNQDELLEDDETLKVTLAQDAAQTPAGIVESIVTIVDSSDPGVITVDADNLTVDESSGQVAVAVTRSASAGGNGSVSGDLLLSWSVSSGTATVGVDLPAQSGSVQWDADASGVGQTGVRNIVIDGIVADDLIEGTETLNLSLTASGDAADRIVLPADPVISILDSSVVVPVELSLVSGSVIAVAENNAGTVQVEVSRSGDLQSEVTLPYTIGSADDTATTDDHNASAGSLFWAAGDASSKFVEVPIIDDAAPELTETLTINFGPVQSPAFALWPASLTSPNLPAPPVVQHPLEVMVTITDDDALLQADDPTAPLILLQVLSELEVRAVNPPLLLAPFEVRAVRVTTPDLPQCSGTDVDAMVAAGCTEPVAGADVSWTVFPDPSGRAGDVAELITADGTAHMGTVRTIADDTGVAMVQVNVLRRGFIGIRAQPTLNVTSSKVTGIDRRIKAATVPTVPSAAGDVVFTIRAGLQTTVGFTTNQARLGFVIDGICDALDNGELPPAASPEEADLYTLCDLELENEENESEAEILSAIDALLPEEYFTIADASVDLADLQITNVYARILAIRSRQLSGVRRTEAVDLSGLSLTLFGESIPSIVADTAVNHALGSGGSSGSSYISPWGFFANGSLAIGEAEDTENETGQDFRTRGLTAGVDYMLEDNLVVGGALGMTRHSSDFRGQQGENDLDGTYLSVFGTYFNPDRGYIDGIVEVGRNSYELSRQINLNLSDPVSGSMLQSTDDLQIADGKTSASSVAITIGAGFDRKFKDYQIGPYGRLSYSYADVDGFEESARFPDRPGIGYVLRIQDHSIRSLRLALGGQFSRTINTRRGVFLPQLRFEAELENEERPESITSSFRFDPTDQEFTIDGDDNDRLVFNYSIGGSAVFKNGKSGFLFYEGQGGHDSVSQHRLKGGFRLEF